MIIIQKWVTFLIIIGLFWIIELFWIVKVGSSSWIRIGWIDQVARSWTRMNWQIWLNIQSLLDWLNSFIWLVNGIWLIGLNWLNFLIWLIGLINWIWLIWLNFLIWVNWLIWLVIWRWFDKTTFYSIIYFIIIVPCNSIITSIVVVRMASTCTGG